VVQALILAGGYGKRLRPLTLETPKPLLEVAGKPVIVWQLEWLRSVGVERVAVLAGYMREKIVEALGSGRRFGVRIVYVVEDEPLGTGGALRNAAHLIEREDYSIVVNGDVLTNVDVGRLLDAVRGGAVAAIAAVPLRSPYGVLELGTGGRVRGFREKPVLGEYWINAGVYAVTPEIVEYLPERGDIEKRGFPELAAEGRLVAVKYSTPPYYWRSIDTHKDLEEASRELKELGGLGKPPQ